MKILHLCDSLNPAGLGGYESYLHYLSEQLSRKGHESLVVTQVSREDMPEYIIHDHYRVRYLPGNLLEAKKWKFYALPDDERERAAADMFSKDDLEMNVKILKEQLLEIIQENRPDIIHAHSTYVVFNRVLMSLEQDGRLKNIPILATIHGRPKSLILPDGKRTTDYEEFLEACPFELILGVSDNVTEVLRKGLHEKGIFTQVRTCYLGINLSVFAPQPKTPKKWDISFMGRLEKMKAVDLFPEMLSILKRDFPNLRFLITGEGSLKENVLEQFDKMSVSTMVEYLGVVEVEKVPDLINQSRIFIYPSREEPFGLSILEAMACAVPVITTNVYGPSEIITQNSDGLMVSPDNVKELSDSIRFLLQNEDLRMIMGNNGRRKVESRFDIKIHTKKLVSIYESMINTKITR
ncbi:MAG: glycosyltransferase family 4 protein [Candidatus Thorarchaeota archaeon]|nr:glycosyltransferase family 4 protein [Candidatus Thorarchaeota archaeon]